jgi:ubiquinone/menaquinone biosynthesis C-methylase UbiE
VDHKEVRHYWDGNAEAWSVLSQAGYDTYRDHLNTPAFLEMLPSVTGLYGLDIGCGNGHNTRLVADLGANITALDVSSIFLHHAVSGGKNSSSSIRFLVASAVELPFPDCTFDFAVAFMSFMDIPETERVISEAYRILKPGGFLQFSITHPCFDTPHRRQVRDATGRPIAVEVGDYFKELEGEITEWSFGAAPTEVRRQFPLFKVPRFTRTLSHWINLLLDNRFMLEHLEEPSPNEETVDKVPNLADARLVAYFLIVRVRKSSTIPLL